MVVGMANQARELRYAEAHTKTLLTVSSVANSIDHATKVGVPLNSLVGLDELITTRLSSNPDIEHFQVVSADGRVLWPIEVKQKPERPSLDQRETVEVRVVSNGILLASVSAAVKTSNVIVVLVPLFVVSLALIITGIVIAHEAANFAFMRGQFTRHAAVTKMLNALGQMRLDVIYRGAHAGAGDPVLETLASTIRSVNERFVRVGRLIRSLQETEPDAQHRAELGRLLEITKGDAQFATGGKPTVVKLDSVATDTRWLAFMAVAASEVLRTALFPAPTSDLTMAAGSVASGLVGSLFGVLLASRRRVVATDRLAGIGIVTMLLGILICVVILNSETGSMDLVLLAARVLSATGTAMFVVACLRAGERSAGQKGMVDSIIGALLGGEIVGPLIGLFGYYLFDALGATVIAALMTFWLIIAFLGVAKSGDLIWRAKPTAELDGAIERRFLPAYFLAVPTGIATGILLATAGAGLWTAEPGAEWSKQVSIWLALGMGSAAVLFGKRHLWPWISAVVWIIYAAVAWFFPAVLGGFSFLALLAGGASVWVLRARSWVSIAGSFAIPPILIDLGISASVAILVAYFAVPFGLKFPTLYVIASAGILAFVTVVGGGMSRIIWRNSKPS